MLKISVIVIKYSDTSDIRDHKCYIHVEDPSRQNIRDEQNCANLTQQVRKFILDITITYALEALTQQVF